MTSAGPEDCLHLHLILKPIPRHFKRFHECNAALLKIKGIGKLNLDGRGGDLKQKLARLEAHWIMKIESLQPNGLKKVIHFVLFL